MVKIARWCRTYWRWLAAGGGIALVALALLLWRQQACARAEIAASTLLFRATEAEAIAAKGSEGAPAMPAPAVADVIAQYPNTRTAAIAALQLAARELQRGEWAAVRTLLQPITERFSSRDPLHALALEGLATAAEGEGNLQEAAMLYERLAGYPVYADRIGAARSAIRVLAGTGRMDEAKALLVRFVAAHPDDDAVKEFQETESVWLEYSAGISSAH